MNYKRKTAKKPKRVSWSSPKEYQQNNVPRVLHKVKPKQYCKVLKGEHKLYTAYREFIKWYSVQSDGRKGSYLVTQRCTCGHTEIKFDKAY